MLIIHFFGKFSAVNCPLVLAIGRGISKTISAALSTSEIHFVERALSFYQNLIQPPFSVSILSLSA
jgi:hypothetical protein